MNIFFLDRDPRAAARMLCDKHVPKMLLESVQILCTVSFLRGKIAPYRATHMQHPCVKWTNACFPNWQWLNEHVLWLSREYESRFFPKTHKSSATWGGFRSYGRPPQVNGPQIITPPAQAMPEQYRCTRTINGAVEAYRAYYKGEKAKFAKWERGTPAPEWW